MNVQCIRVVYERVVYEREESAMMRGGEKHDECGQKKSVITIIIISPDSKPASVILQSILIINAIYLPPRGPYRAIVLQQQCDPGAAADTSEFPNL